MTDIHSIGDGMERTAVISDDGMYRYDLTRRWADGPMLGFVMCNPSTADADSDDPTIRRCVGFARREGAGGITVRNLWALRTPDPRVLGQAIRSGADVVGPMGSSWLINMGRHCPRVVAAWGALAGLGESREVRAAIRRQQGLTAWCLQLERFEKATGSVVAPHPLYLRADTPITAYPTKALNP